MNIEKLICTELEFDGKRYKIYGAKFEKDSIILSTEEIKEVKPEIKEEQKETKQSKGKKVCVIIGHGGNDCGAVSQDKKVTELAYNTEVADDLVEALQLNGYEAFTHNRGYSKMENTTLINSLNPDLVISLHCNSADNAAATGTEAIHYPGSVNGKKIAELLSKNVSEALGLKNRGAKEPWHGRGSGLLSRVKAPCIISEPFFISNNADLKSGLEKKNGYIGAIIKSIDEYFA